MKPMTDIAAEHFVLYRLHMQGLVASLTPRNAPVGDILVWNPDGSVLASIQVKARSGTKGKDAGWMMKKKHEDIQSPSLVYAFVDLEPGKPEVYLVPSKVVADVLKKSHDVWSKTPGTRKAVRDASTEMRRLRFKHDVDVPGYPHGWLEKYHERWDFLKAPLLRK